MAKSLWSALRRALGGGTRFPAPRVPDGTSAAELKDTLAAFHAADPQRFARLFLHGEPAAAAPGERGRFDAWERAGLVRRLLAGAYRPCVRVFPLYGAMVATDLLSHDAADQVFSLMLEQVLLVRNLGVRPGDHVLELCLGSGVNSLFASDVAARVVGVDVSPRALEFARFNAALNPGAVRVETRLGSLWGPLEPDERFDLVLVNPPFEPVPPGADHFLHSHGGEDGLDVVREILAGAPARLRPGGRFTMFTWSPGDDSSVTVAALVRAAFPGHRVQMLLADHRPLDQRIEQFRDAPGFAAWRDRLRAAGITRIWGVLVTATPDGPPGTAVDVIEDEDEVLACRGIVSEWT